MNRKEFILKLKENLIGMDQSEKREILLDYEEHFLDGKTTGRSEEDICESLGDPKEIAFSLRQTKKESGPKSNTAGNIIGIIALSIGCLWLLNVILGMVASFFGITVGIIALFTMPFGIGIKLVAIAALVFALSLIVLIVFGLIKLIVLICRWFQSLFNGLNNGSPNTREFKMFKPKAWVWIVMVTICVLSLFVMTFGGIKVAADIAVDYRNGEFDEMIEEIEYTVNDEEFILAIEELERLEDLDHMGPFEALDYLDRLDHFDRMGRFDHRVFRDFIFEVLD